MFYLSEPNFERNPVKYRLTAIRLDLQDGWDCKSVLKMNI